MNRAILFLCVFMMTLGASVIYYFFGFELLVKNETGGHNFKKVACINPGGRSWIYDLVSPGGSTSKMAFLSSGDRMECSFQVDGYPIQKSLIIGYYDESIKKIGISLRSNEQGLYITVQDYSSSATLELDKIVIDQSTSRVGVMGTLTN